MQFLTEHIVVEKAHRRRRALLATQLKVLLLKEPLHMPCEAPLNYINKSTDVENVFNAADVIYTLVSFSFLPSCCNK